MSQKNQPWVIDSDIFVEEAMDFFENREDSNKDIVDILVKVTSDALGINIYIYQKETDKKRRRDYILCMRSMQSEESKEVHLKFTHNNLQLQGNHYDPRLCMMHQSIQTNLDLLSTVAEYATKLPDVICIWQWWWKICHLKSHVQMNLFA